MGPRSKPSGTCVGLSQWRKVSTSRFSNLPAQTGLSRVVWQPRKCLKTLSEVHSGPARFRNAACLEGAKRLPESPEHSFPQHLGQILGGDAFAEAPSQHHPV